MVLIRLGVRWCVSERPFFNLLVTCRLLETYKSYIGRTSASHELRASRRPPSLNPSGRTPCWAGPYRVEVDHCRAFVRTRSDMVRLTRSPKLVQRLVCSLHSQWADTLREDLSWLRCRCTKGVYDGGEPQSESWLVEAAAPDLGRANYSGGILEPDIALWFPLAPLVA